jgi:DNA-binding winged helix-turn-helix (wHTH) protein/tetratricopeptide (TPR) repeat protein
MRSFDGFRLDVVNQCLWREETRVSLMPKPFAVLRYLVDHPNRLVTHDELLAAVWPDTHVQPEVLRRYVLEIRRALGDQADAPRFLQTFAKRGYQFIAPLTDDAETSDVDSTSAPARSLVGRQSALTDLDRCLARALGGRRQVVFVVGEPGIGKTSLVDAFHRSKSTTAGISVVRGQSVEGFGGKEAYYPLLEAIGLLARGPSRTLVIDVLTATAPTWLVQLPSLISADQQAGLQRDILGATRERMVRELCEALEIITETAPLVLILEDLHWVDRSTVDALSAIARRREPARLLVLGTFRPADLILYESPLKTLRQDLLVHRLSHEVELERLEEADVAAYIATEFAPGDLPAGLASAIYRYSDGNPLFMTAMLDHLVQQNVLCRRDGRWAMSIPIDQIDPAAPETLKQLLEMQLRYLTGAEQQVLRCASVAGQQFTAWSVNTMLAESADAEPTCESLAERQQFLKPAGPRQLPDGAASAAYEFRHALYREVLYRRLSPALRVEFHRRLARGLEKLRSPVESEMAAEIALHFEEGHEFEPAARYLMLASQNATRRYAHNQAVAVLEHAQELLRTSAKDDRPDLTFQLWQRIGNAYYALGDMEKSARAYASMATAAADAGRLAEQADVLIREGHTAESIPFFHRAVEIDPDFAMAYVTLSRIYSNLGEVEQAKSYAKLAYARTERVGDRERLSITYQYHYEVTGNQPLATGALEMWKQSFPVEFQPANSLALIHNFLGNFERAVEEGLEAVRRSPSHGYSYSNLALAYRGLGRFDDAQRTAERAVALGIETLPTRCLLYQLAIAAGDRTVAQRHLEWARDRPREFEMVAARAQAAAWAGRVREARQLCQDAAGMAELRQLHDVGAAQLAWAASMELAFGGPDSAIRLARLVLGRTASYDPRLRVALVLAATGSTAEAEAIADVQATANPEHTFVNAVLVPIVRGAIELSSGRPARALECLRAAAPYELGFVAALAPTHLSGQAHLALGAGAEAAEQFQRILDHRGTDLFSPFHAVAPVGLARALAMAGDLTGSLAAYERFLSAWAEADEDVPVLVQARDEHRRLRAAPSRGVPSQTTGRPGRVSPRRHRKATG